MKQDISVSMIEANFYAVFATLPFIITIFGLYILIWKWHKFFDGLNLSFINLIICLIAIFTGIVIHELLHGLSWQFFGNKQFNTIKYGIDPKTWSPYAHCKEAIDIKAYRLGIAMPGLILGFLPAIAAILTGNSFILTFGLFFILAAGGDILILWLLRNVKSSSFVQDHPTRVGCYILS